MPKCVEVVHLAVVWGAFLDGFQTGQLPWYRSHLDNSRADWARETKVLFPLWENRVESYILYKSNSCRRAVWAATKPTPYIWKYRWYRPRPYRPNTPFFWSNHSIHLCSASRLRGMLHCIGPRWWIFRYLLWKFEALFPHRVQRGDHVYPSPLFVWPEILFGFYSDRKCLWWRVPSRGVYPVSHWRTGVLQRK